MAACRLVWAGFATSLKAWGSFVETQFSANQSPPRRSLALFIIAAGLIEFIRGAAAIQPSLRRAHIKFSKTWQIKLRAALTTTFDAICRLRVS